MVKKTNLVLFGAVLFLAGAAIGKLSNQPANAHSAIGRVLKLEELSFTDFCVAIW